MNDALVPADSRVANDGDDDSDEFDDVSSDDASLALLDGEQQLQADAHDHADDLQMHDLGRYGISGFSGLGLAWGTLAVVVAVFGAPVTAGPSLLLLVLWLVVWIGTAVVVNAGMGAWQRRSLSGRVTLSLPESAGGAGTPTAIPGMRP